MGPTLGPCSGLAHAALGRLEPATDWIRLKQH